jgi:hypothetical protein
MHAARAGTLRLVDTLPAAVRPARIAEVERANQAAAVLPELTAQSLFAATVANSLEGGPAGVLPADSRRRLVAAAVRLGIREFDAHLIIAMVQERARTERTPRARTMQPAERVQRTMRSGSHSPDAARGVSPATLLFLAIVVAALLFGAAARWLSGS